MITKPIPKIIERDAIRFWSKIQKGTPKPCWLWQAGLFTDGYGAFQLQGKTYRAHRIAYKLRYGTIPTNHCVMHRCDNPLCCNPNHLTTGTSEQNTADRYQKGRSAKGKHSGQHTHPERTARGDRSGMRTHPESVPRGERDGMSKLTTKEIQEIRAKYAKGNTTYRALAQQYHVTFAHIGRIIRSISWAHLS